MTDKIHEIPTSGVRSIVAQQGRKAMAVVILAHNKKLTFKWLRFPVTGIEGLDRQHQELLDQLNDLKGLLTEGCDPTIVAERLRGLHGWFDRHFEAENQLMRTRDLSDAAAHIAAHQALLEGPMFQTTFAADGQEGFDIDALFTWEAQHINHFDRPLAEFLLTRES
ncbi:Bacteriohemerythrin [Candidatus Magnetaquicoccaceae bacterium FCR-1]|uniref:Bacteriohemerythrin n=2 Tax=Candidatus Magnetaquiglobus chichijimensis TaxID=3141448 RepID=A0ABQ0CD32_9PROT